MVYAILYRKTTIKSTKKANGILLNFAVATGNIA
jgi:hypothetical protein